MSNKVIAEDFLKDTKRIEKKKEIFHVDAQLNLKPEIQEVYDSLCTQMQLFVKAYLTNGLRRELAALTAGYTVQEAYQKARELLYREDIKLIVYNSLESASERNGISMDYLFQQLKEVIHMAKGGKTDRAGYYDGNLVISAIDRIAKLTGSYAPDKILNKNDHTISMSDNQDAHADRCKRYEEQFSTYERDY